MPYSMPYSVPYSMPYSMRPQILKSPKTCIKCYLILNYAFVFIYEQHLYVLYLTVFHFMHEFKCDINQNFMFLKTRTKVITFKP